MSVADTLQRAGIQPRHTCVGDQRLPCPRCDKGQRDTALSLTLEADGGCVWHCFRCEWTGGSHPDSWVNAYAATQAQLEGPRWQKRQAQLQERSATTQHARETREAQAAESARALWKAAQPAPIEHAYVARKRLSLEGLRFVDRFQSIEQALLVPMRDRHSEIVNLQGIDPDGEKRFMMGARTKGAFALVSAPGTMWLKGELPARIAVGEGFATVHSFLKMRPNFRGVAAMSAGNLVAVAEIMRDKFPSAQLVIAADQDLAGARAAGEAAITVNAEIWFPGFGQLGINDWSDLERELEA